MRREKVQELRKLCEDVHVQCKYPAIPWSPNRCCVHLEGIEENEAVFSTYAAYWESWGRMAGTFRLPLAECGLSRIEEETEMSIGFSKEVDRSELTSLHEDVGLPASPSHPVMGGSEFRTLPTEPGVAEMLGGEDGMAYSGSDKMPVGSGFRHLPAEPTKESTGKYFTPSQLKAYAKKESTVDDPNMVAPNTKKEDDSSELSRTNISNVAIPEWGSVGTIDTAQLPHLKGEALGDLGGKTGMTMTDEAWVQAFEATLSDEEARGTRQYKHAIAVIVKDGCYVLLGKAVATDDRDGKWCFPGGHIDPEDGGDPVAGAIREAYEETGLQVTSKGEIINHPDKPNCAFVVCLYADRAEPTPNKEFTQLMWVEYDARDKIDLDIYAPNREVLERLPADALYASVRLESTLLDSLGLEPATRAALRDILGETTALKRQDQNKRAWAVSANDRRVTTGVAAEPFRRSIAGSSDHVQDKPTDKAVSATQAIKGKHTLSSPAAPQDSAEKLHFQSGAKSPRKAAADAEEDMERQKQGRDPAALKPGDAGQPGTADAEKEARQGKGGKAPPPGGPPGAASVPAQAPAMQPGAAAPVPMPMQQGGPPMAQGKPPMKPGQAPQPPIAGQPALPLAAQPTQPPAPGAPPGQVGQAPGGQQAGQKPKPGQPGQGAPGQQPVMPPAGAAQQQAAMMQPGMGGQPGLDQGMTPPMMQPTGMPAFAPRVVDLVLQDRVNADKCLRWLQALGFQPVTPDFTTVQVTVSTHEEMHLVGRTAKAFGLEMSGIIPR